MHDDTSTDSPSTGTPGEEPRPLFASHPGPTEPVDAGAGDRAPTPPADASASETTTVVEPVARPDGADTASGETTTAIATTEGASGSVPPGTRDDRRWPAWARWAAVVPLVLLVVVAVWIGWLFADHAGTALPGVTVEGFDASGMDGAAIAANLDNIVTSRRDAEVAVRVGEPLDGEHVFRLGADGYEADVDSTVEAALAAGRDGPIGSVVTHVRAALDQTAWTIPLHGESVDAGVDAFLADVAAEVDRDPTRGDITINPDTLEVTTEEPVRGYRAEVDEIRDDLEDLAGTGESATLTVPVTTLDPLVDPANVEQVAARTRQVLAEAYVLGAEGQSLTIDPSEIVQLLSIERGDDGYRLSIDADGVVAMLEGRGERFRVAPKSASYEVQSGYRTFDEKGSATFEPSPAEVTLNEGRNGRRFNPEVAGARLVELFQAGEHRGEFKLDVVEADFTTKEARAAKPDALLGSFTTYHDAGGARVFNIHLLADLIDGEMLPPGDDFSVNRDIGDRTEEKGFKEAGAIIDGELVETDVGGGVSQLATTFYNAAFFAGIDIQGWKPHSWPISRYPLAREATFSYAAGFDIHITNNTPGALIVKTSYTDTSVSVYVFGQDDGRTVRAVMGEPHDYTDFEVEERGTDELCRGQSRTVQTGAQGFTVDYRRVIKGGNDPKTEDFSWAYSPKSTIIENGTRDC